MTSQAAEYDYVVVGAGAAGSIVAGQLSAAGHAVLLMEVGQVVPADDADVWNPARWYEVLKTPSFELGFTSTPQEKLRNRTLNLLQSKGLGGCQIHNAMVYVRGGRSTYDYWAAGLGCAGWGYDDLIPFFETVENTVGISSPAPTAFTDAFVAAAGRLGFPLNPQYNGGPTEFGCVPFQFTVDADGPRRTTSFEAFVGPAPPPTLTVLTQCFVRRLTFGQGAPTVEYADATGQILTVQPTQEVILSAGAIATPAILLRSGVGPANELAALGIAVVADLPAVGKNFYDDLGVGVFVEPADDLPGQNYGYLGVGVFATASGAPPGPVPAYGEVNLEIQISTSSLPGAPPLPAPLPPSRYCIIGASSLHLKSRGEVTLASADPTVAPLVDPAWLTAPEDIEQVFSALALTLQFAGDPDLAAAGGWTPLSLPPIDPYDPVFPIEAALEWIELTGMTVQHYVGSCQMGLDPTASVVSPADLRVHGLSGLRVVDASIAPTPVTGNTAGVSMVIGAKGASLILNG